jgi:protein involved in polysaccharide export with SLBB domain
MRTIVFISLLITLVTTGCTTHRGPDFDPRDPNDPTVVEEFSITNALNPEWLKPSPEEFRLGPGDHVEIELIGVREPSTDTLIGPDGRVYFHLLSGVNVWGLTLTEACGLLESELKQYVNHPRVAITLRDVGSRRVWVLGRLTRPGIYPLDRPMTVLDAVTLAGGLYTAQFTGTTEELADLQHSFLVRGGQFMPVNFKRLIHEGDMSQNVYLQPDDFIYLPSALATEVYVLGAVAEPRAVPFKDQVTLSSAIANARGTLPEALLRRVVIIRGSLTEPHCTVVNFSDILRGKAPEVLLQPRDIVYVPDQPLGILENAAKLIVDTFVRTVAANEGITAAGGVGKVGVGVNVGD